MVEVSLSGAITLSQWVISSANRLKGKNKNIFALHIHAGLLIAILINTLFQLFFHMHIESLICFITNLPLFHLIQIISRY